MSTLLDNQGKSSQTWSISTPSTSLGYGGLTKDMVLPIGQNVFAVLVQILLLTHVAVTPYKWSKKNKWGTYQHVEGAREGRGSTWMKLPIESDDRWLYPYIPGPKTAISGLTLSHQLEDLASLSNCRKLGVHEAAMQPPTCRALHM
ncbi:hypothetical protein BS17DRAFT_764406 [Gyrodon lividus]|nr:hypothetical protein BS17DRAFT_764406 [Gyrodon lividus]